MYLYNVTVKVECSIAKDWLHLMIHEHIPEILSTGCFTDAKLLQILEIDDDEGPTYATQYFAATEDDYRKYISSFATNMRQKGIDKWGDRFIAFRTLMKSVN